MYKYTNGENTLDRELILNEEYSNLMFNTENLFVDYIITYTMFHVKHCIVIKQNNLK